MTGPERAAELDEWNSGWGVFEDRVRDPAWLNGFTGREPREPYRRAECCWDAERWICEIPRSRIQGTKVIELPPARFRLCHHHATELERNEPDAQIYESKVNIRVGSD